MRRLPEFVLVLALLAAPSFAQDTPECALLPENVVLIKCRCPAKSDVNVGQVWGSDRYSADSDICSAAKHAGALWDESRVLTVFTAAMAAPFHGTLRNGVISLSRTAAGPGFEFYPRRKAKPPMPVGKRPIGKPGAGAEF